jgi:aryl-alcohol dehydrogenase-like predicted oxidoreductase
MRYRRVGTSALTVSEIAFGTWRTFGSSSSDSDARTTILRAYERGVTLFDTANIYRRGAAEELLGATLGSLPRESWLVCTKAGYPMGDRPGDQGLSRRHLIEQCERSLRRLGVDHIDLFVCHRPDDHTPLEETLCALDELASQGKVRHVGVSSFPAASLADAHATGRRLGLRPLTCNQPQYSLTAREPEAAEIPEAAAVGMGTIAWAPLAQGVLTGKYRPGVTPAAGTRGGTPGYRPFIQHLMADEQLRKVQALVPIAEAAGLSMARMALAWVLRRPEVSSAVVGASTASQLEELLAASGTELSSNLLTAIDAVFPPPGGNQ